MAREGRQIDKFELLYDKIRAVSTVPIKRSTAKALVTKQLRFAFIRLISYHVDPNLEGA